MSHHANRRARCPQRLRPRPRRPGPRPRAGRATAGLGRAGISSESSVAVSATPVDLISVSSGGAGAGSVPRVRSKSATWFRKSRGSHVNTRTSDLPCDGFELCARPTTSPMKTHRHRLDTAGRKAHQNQNDQANKPPTGPHAQSTARAARHVVSSQRKDRQAAGTRQVTHPDPPPETANQESSPTAIVLGYGSHSPQQNAAAKTPERANSLPSCAVVPSRRMRGQ